MPTITEKIYNKIFEILEENPQGIQWSKLMSQILESDNTLHPKTVNGSIWKLVEKYPNKVYKPEKGLFRLLKYK
jgi:hypothetical protein